MDKFISDLFQPKKTPILSESERVNAVINESILYDRLGYEKLSQFFDNIGAYGARDGILSECIGVCDPNKDCRAEIAAILACAKEANSPDYENYLKAMEAQKAYFEKMKIAFGDVAKSKIETQTNELEKNARVQDALSKISPEGCSKTEGCCKR